MDMCVTIATSLSERICQAIKKKMLTFTLYILIAAQAGCERDTRGFLALTYSPLVTRSEERQDLGAGPGGG